MRPVAVPPPPTFASAGGAARMPTAMPNSGRCSLGVPPHGAAPTGATAASAISGLKRPAPPVYHQPPAAPSHLAGLPDDFQPV